MVFFLIDFCEPEASFLHLFSSTLPLLRGQPTVEYHPRWQPIQGLAIHCRLGKLPDSNPGLQVYSLVSLPMSHHCSQLNYVFVSRRIQRYSTSLVSCLWVPDISWVISLTSQTRWVLPACTR
jgi:hypothetical protein